MARLSAEHYRANANMTPDPTRKSSRIRDMFRARSGYSPSVSSFQTQPLPQSSPVSTPIVKVGFEQVGLLPAERHSNSKALYESLPTPAQSSFTIRDRSLIQAGNLSLEPQRTGEQQVNRAAYMLYQQQEVLGGPTASLDILLAEGIANEAHIHNAGLEVKRNTPVVIGRVSKSALAERRANQQQDAVRTVDNAVRQYLQSASTNITTIMKEQEAGASLIDLGSGSSSGMRCGTPSNATLGSPTTKNNRRFKSSGLGIPASPRDTVDNDRSDKRDERGDGSSEDESQDSNRKSFASNIFDDKDSLSQGIREYVASKIAEALLEHDRKFFKESGKIDGSETAKYMMPTAVAPLNVSINFDLSEFAKLRKIHARLPGVLTGLKRLGPTIINPTIATKLQAGIIAIYGILLVGAAVVGPATLFVMLWRLAIFFLIYLFAVCRVLACDEWSTEVFLAPVFHLYRMLPGLNMSLGAVVWSRSG